MRSRANVAAGSFYVPGEPERALMRAVLRDAFECLNAGAHASRTKARDAADARAWIAERDTSWPFSFDNICSSLDLDGERLRKRLLQIDPAVAPVIARRPRVREEEVVALIHAGRSLRQIAEQLGITVPQASTLSRALTSRLKAQRDERIVELRAAGWTPIALANHFGLSAFRIRRICARACRSARKASSPHAGSGAGMVAPARAAASAG